MDYLYLIIAIISEVIATTLLKESEGLNKICPIIIVITGYTLSFILLALVLKTIPIGIAYSYWAGLGIIFITIVGHLFYNQKLDNFAITGMILIIVGIILINLFSQTNKN